MKNILLFIALLWPVLSLQAQSQKPKAPASTQTTKPSSTTQPATRTQTTRPATTTTADEARKRQQLYDEYHGVKKNAPAASSTKTPTRTVRREAVAPARNQQATTVTRSPGAAQSAGRATKASSQPTSRSSAPQKTAATPKKSGATPPTATSEPTQNTSRPPVVSETRTSPQKAPVRTTAQPQINRRSPSAVSVGLRIGANTRPNQITDPVDIGFDAEVESVIGLLGGVMVNIPVGSSGFSIQPEALYSIRRSRANVFGNFVDVRHNIIEVPLLVKYTFGDPIEFFVNVGPYAAYTLNGRSEGRFSGTSFSRPISYGQGNDGRFEYGATGGIGVVVPVGGSSVLVEGRYTRALGVNLEPRPRQYPQLFSLNLTYILPF